MRVSTFITILSTIVYFGSLVMMLNLENTILKIYGIVGAGALYVVHMAFAITARELGMDEMAKEAVRKEREERERNKKNKGEES